MQEQEKEGSEVKDISFSLPGLDIERGLDFYDGDTEDYLSAMYSFIKNVPEIADKLRVVTQENLAEYAINVHSLKSISSWICAESIRSEAAELEALAKAGNYSDVSTRNGKFVKDVNNFVKDLGTLLKENFGK
jgi:HPt (histidine-containing phosphotransfer) domain-containing protein